MGPLLKSSGTLAVDRGGKTAGRGAGRYDWIDIALGLQQPGLALPGDGFGQAAREWGGGFVVEQLAGGADVGDVTRDLAGARGLVGGVGSLAQAHADHVDQIEQRGARAVGEIDGGVSDLAGGDGVDALDHALHAIVM